MQLIATLAGLAGIIVLVVGMIRPATFGGGRGRVWGLGLGLFIAGVAGTNYFMSDEDRARYAAGTTARAEAQAERARAGPDRAAATRTERERQGVANRDAAQRPAPPPAPTARVLETSNGGPVFVWRDREKLREANRLIDADVHRTQPTLLVPLLACIVDSGTRIVVNDSGMFTSEVMVIEGRQAGCRGAVSSDRIGRR